MQSIPLFEVKSKAFAVSRVSQQVRSTDHLSNPGRLMEVLRSGAEDARALGDDSGIRSRDADRIPPEASLHRPTLKVDPGTDQYTRLVTPLALKNHYLLHLRTHRVIQCNVLDVHAIRGKRFVLNDNHTPSDRLRGRKECSHPPGSDNIRIHRSRLTTLALTCLDRKLWL